MAYGSSPDGRKPNRIGDSKTVKIFPSGGALQTANSMIQGAMKGATVGATGPIGNRCAFTLFDGTPGDPGVSEKGALVAIFGNASHTTRQGILSLRVSLPDRPPIEVPANDHNQSGLQAIFDRAERGVQKSYDMRAVAGLFASAHTDLQGLPSAPKPFSSKAFQAMP